MKKHAAIYLILLEAGVYGLLLLLLPITGIQCSEGLLSVCAPIPILLLWSTYMYRRKLLPFALGFLCLAAVILCIARPEAALFQIPFIVRCFIGQAYWNAADITEGLLILFILFSILVFLVELAGKGRGHLLLSAFITALAILLAAQGMFLRAPALLLLLGFAVLFPVLHNSERKDIEPLSGVQAMALILVILLPAFAFLQPLAERGADRSYELAYQLDLDLQILARQRAREAFSEEGRTISRGNLQPEGREILEITTDKRPTETVYLRSFSGGDYQNGTWKIHRDMEIFETLRNGSTERADAAYSQFRNLYYRMNWQYGEAAVRELSVHRFNKKTTGAMDTYYAADVETENRSGMSARDTISYFERKDMQFDWDDTGWRHTDTQNIDMFTADNEALHQNYQREAQQVYTALPALRLSGFRQLQEENPREGLADITAFIRGTLREHGVYTRNPGVCPLSRDPVEYFFFENHKGYCQHFASAAVILYRLYDVPARYAAGYAVTPSEFEALPDGTYRAVVTDASAHAWPEAFREDIGWTPVEVTPGGAGASSALTDTPDPDGEEDVVRDVLPLETPDGGNADRTDRDTEAPAKSDTGGISAAGKLGASAAAVLLVLLLLHVYRMLCRRAYQKMNSRQLFSRLLKILHFADCLPDCDGNEVDFPKRLAEEVSGLSEEAAAEAVAIVEREAFGPPEFPNRIAPAQTASAQTAITEAAGMDKAEVKAEAAAEEAALVRQLCSQTAAALYAGLPRHRKLWFKYGRNFLL